MRDRNPRATVVIGFILALCAGAGVYLLVNATSGPRNGVTKTKIRNAIESTGYRIGYRDTKRAPKDNQIVAGSAYGPNGAQVDFAVSICRCEVATRSLVSQAEPAVRYEQGYDWTAVANVGFTLVPQAPREARSQRSSTEEAMVTKLYIVIKHVLPGKFQGGV